LRLNAADALITRPIVADLPPIESVPAMQSDAEDASDLGKLLLLRRGWCVWIARHDGSLAEWKPGSERGRKCLH